MNIRRIANEVYQAMWSRPQCTLPRARNMRQEDIDRIAKAIDDAVQDALNQPVLVSEWQEQQSELTQLREQSRVLRHLASTAVELWRAQTNVKEGISFRMAMKALEAALTATSQPTVNTEQVVYACGTSAAGPNIPRSCPIHADCFATSQEGQG